MASNFSSITFTGNGAAVEGDALHAHIVNQNYTSERGVRINGSDYASATVRPDGSMTLNAGPSTGALNMARVSNGSEGILATANRAGTPVAAHDLRPTDLVRFGGQELTVEVAERIGLLSRNEAGRIVNAGASSVREATGEADAARAAEADRDAAARAAEIADLNKHPVPEIEDAHAAFTSKVSTSDQIAALIQVQSNDGVMQPALVHRIGEALGVQPEAALETMNTLALGVQAQFKTLANARGVNADDAANWIREHKASQVMSALQAHVLGRDVRAWDGLIADYKRTLPRG